MSKEHPKEQVLVIPAKLATELCPGSFGQVPALCEHLILSNHSFRDREEAETNTKFKQVIPYIVVTHGGNILLTRRTNKQQEARLHDKYSVGQGGHINELDFGTERSPIIAGMMREIAEEFTLAEVEHVSCLGLINDNSNDVGKVHLGLVYLMRVASGAFVVAEEGKHIAEWVAASQLRRYYPAMENWSKIVVDHALRPQ